MEATSNQNDTPEVDVKVEEAVQTQLQERLSIIEVPEHIPSWAETLYRLDTFLQEIDTPDWKNEDRHISREAEAQLQEALGSISHKHYLLYTSSDKYRPVRNQPPVAA